MYKRNFLIEHLSTYQFVFASISPIVFPFVYLPEIQHVHTTDSFIVHCLKVALVELLAYLLCTVVDIACSAGS